MLSLSQINKIFLKKLYYICKKRKVWPYIGGKKSIRTVPEEAQMLDLLDKGIKPAMINMFKNLKETMV